MILYKNNHRRSTPHGVGGVVGKDLGSKPLCLLPSLNLGMFLQIPGPSFSLLLRCIMIFILGVLFQT